MQYVRNLSDSVSTAWNSINPATLSGAIDVIVVEQDDGTLACSPFHVRFGKFSLLRPYERKVEFKVNGAKQDYAMKLGEGGEAFFVFETSDNIPQDLQTSPLVSPASSPPLPATERTASGLQEPPLLELDTAGGSGAAIQKPQRPPPAIIYSTSVPKDGIITPLSTSPNLSASRPKSGDWSSSVEQGRPHSEDVLRSRARKDSSTAPTADHSSDEAGLSQRSQSPAPAPFAGGAKEAIERAIALSRELLAVNIPTQVTETGDLMLDMTGFKSSEEDAIRAEILARKILSEELDGNYDIGALFGMDEQGNLWIYSSEDAKEAAMKRTEASLARASGGGAVSGGGRGRPPALNIDAASDPGYQSDGSDMTTTAPLPLAHHRRADSDVGQTSGNPDQLGLAGPSTQRLGTTAGDPNVNYAKTLRLTSDQLKALALKPGENAMSFTVGRATCSAFMYLWRHDTPVVVSDIDGTITKSDALGHVLNMIGRDWTHTGVAKLYSDIAQNGYNIMYLTSRSVGQADTTRAYLNGIVQDGGYRLPRGPTILSPDRTMAALRREIYLRKPHVFKMSTLRDIRSLYGAGGSPFYAGFGNRLTDQISYRTVDVPRNRIFTINSNAEVSLDLLSLNKLKLSYISMTEIVEHYFPPVSTLVRGGGEEFTDFTYWRDTPLEIDDFSASDSDEPTPGAGGAGANAALLLAGGGAVGGLASTTVPSLAVAAAAAGKVPATRSDADAALYADYAEEDEDDEDVDDDDDEAADGMGDSYISRESADEYYGEGSVLSGSAVDEEPLGSSMVLEEDDADDEEGGEEDEEEDEVVGGLEEGVQEEDEEEQVAEGDAADVHVDDGGDADKTEVLKLEEAVIDAINETKKLVTSEDISAELITGVKSLSLRK